MANTSGYSEGHMVTVPIHADSDADISNVCVKAKGESDSAGINAGLNTSCELIDTLEQCFSCELLQLCLGPDKLLELRTRAETCKQQEILQRLKLFEESLRLSAEHVKRQQQEVVDLQLHLAMQRSKLEEIEQDHVAKLNDIQQKFEQRLAELQVQLASSRPGLHLADRSARVQVTAAQPRTGEADRLIDPEPKITAYSLQSCLWTVATLSAETAAVFCSFDGLKIRRVSQGAFALLGSELIGKSLYDVVTSPVLAFKLERTFHVKQALAEASSADVPGFLTHKLGEYELKSPNPHKAALKSGMQVVHVPADRSRGEDKAILVIFSAEGSCRLSRQAFGSGKLSGQHGRQRAHSICSDASSNVSVISDISPSDSVSVTEKEALPGSLRRKLKPSFFSLKGLRDGTSDAPSSGINSPRC